MKNFYFILFSFVLFTSCKKVSNELAEGVSFENPLLSTGPDPWVVQKDSFYYYTNTLGDRLEIWKTKSMSKLAEAEEKLVWQSPQQGVHAFNLWAPELHYLNGKWYLYYAANSTNNIPDQRIFVLENSSNDPMTGTWVDKGQVVDSSNNNIFSIDPTILELNNKQYLIYSSVPNSSSANQGIYISEMINPWTLSSSRVLISTPTYDWEKQGSSNSDGINEGPEILKSNNNIFLIFSASACWTDGYCLGVCSFKSGGDPLNINDWVKQPRPVFNSDLYSNTYGPGHCAFFKSPDGKEDWILYHAHTGSGLGCDWNRNPRIQKFTWDNTGSPDFGEPVPSDTRIYRPSGEKD